MKNTKQRLFQGALILALAVVIFTAVFFILALCKVLPANPFKLAFAIFTYGIGGVFVLYGLALKGGYEIAVGYLLLVVGTIIVLIGLLKWYVIALIVVAMLFLGLLLLLVFKSNHILIPRTDESPNFKPYSEVLAEKKVQDAIEESKPLPTLKDYSKED
ncbi:MAG: hypothetical protein IKA99_07375 [Clostridia bacterium]|nr:hypothetical protein [Clostridia bacterium]